MGRGNRGKELGCLPAGSGECLPVALLPPGAPAGCCSASCTLGLGCCAQVGWGQSGAGGSIGASENPALASWVGVLNIFPNLSMPYTPVPFHSACYLYVYLFMLCLVPEKGMGQRILGYWCSVLTCGKFWSACPC